MMSNLKNHSATALLAALALFLAACGSGGVTGEGTVVVTGLAPDQELLCGGGQGDGPGSTVVILGNGFLSEHGTGIQVLWTALEGTPFEGGTSATTTTDGEVLSDTQVEVGVPSGFGEIEVTITVILPGGNEGTSPPQTISIGGILVGPFAQPDLVPGTIGNVPTTVPAPGVLENDIPAFCANDEEPRKPVASGDTAAVADFVVVAPPMGFEGDATPGVAKATQLGGQVTIQADGSFVYSPPVGVTGTSDTFWYWMQEGAQGPSRGFVSLPIENRVWFIDRNADGLNNGHFESPYESIADFMAEQGGGALFPSPGDTIFVHDQGAMPPYNGELGLLDDQVLLGEGFGLTIGMRTIVPAGTRPILTNDQFAIGEISGDTVIRLADRNTIRGLRIEAPNLHGIFGIGVAGPTLIDDVHIEDSLSSCIRLLGVSGTFRVGDPANMNVPTVSIDGAGSHGIEIQGEGQITSATALAAGPTLEVFGAWISNITSNGVDATDANVVLTGGEIDNCNVGVYQRTFFSGTCSFDATDVVSGSNTPQRFRGIVLDPLFGAGIVATIRGCTTIANEEALYGVEFDSSGILVSLAGNTWENLVTGNVPAVRLQGNGETDNVIIREMDGEIVNGNGSGGGIIAGSCAFDADLGTAGYQAVATDTLQIGNSAGARVEDTALQLYGCRGALTIGTLTIWQVIGNPAGYVNTGPLTLTITTEVIDVTP